MAVLRPLKLIIDNYPEDQEEMLEAEYNAENIALGSRKIPFSKVLYIEQEDFMEDPPKKFFRLAPGREVRLKSAYIIMCQHVVKDETGQVVEVHCTYDPETKSGSAAGNRKVKGTLHWVSAAHAKKIQTRLYQHLFLKDNPEEDENFTMSINPDSLEILESWIEPQLAGVLPGTRYQFLRQGYFAVDEDSTPDNLVFNRVVSLKDSWAKVKKQ